MRLPIFVRHTLLLIVLHDSLAAQPPDSVTVQRLYYTAKVWGYMKYFHSEVAKGSYNWDSVLIQTLPNVINASSDAQFNAAILSMIKKPGSTARTFIPPPVIPESLKYNLDLAWMNDPIFSSEVIDSLNAIKTWARNRNNYYVQQDPGFANSNPIFPNDKQFYDKTFPLSQEIRLLGLFRYWNIINYFYPHKNILDHTWDYVLTENITVFSSATTYASFLRAVLALQHNLNDSHASTATGTVIDTLYPNLPVSTGGYYLPAFLNYVEGNTVVMKVLIPGSGIKPGDIVKKINGVDIQTIRDGLRPYTAGSNATVIDRNINYRLTRGKQNENVQWDIESSDGAHTVTLTRTLEYATWRSQVFRSTPSWQKVTRNGVTFGIVNMEKLVESEIDPLFKDLASTDGIIFDLRNYPNWTNWLYSRYLFSQSVDQARYTCPSILYPGTFNWILQSVGGPPLLTPYNGIVAILFNEETQSLSEATVMTLENHPRAIKIGSQTSGADGNVSNVYLPGTLQVWFTGLGWFYPDYTPTQRIGIKPDIEVKPTIVGVREGKDELLERAVNYIVGSKYPNQTIPFAVGNQWIYQVHEYSVGMTGNRDTTYFDTVSVINSIITGNDTIWFLSSGDEIMIRNDSIFAKNPNTNIFYLQFIPLNNTPSILPNGTIVSFINDSIKTPFENYTFGIFYFLYLASESQIETYGKSIVPGIGIVKEFASSSNPEYNGGYERNLSSFKIMTAVTDRGMNVNNFSLSQNFPNPFNPTTNIRFEIPVSGFVSLKIFDLLGREVATLVNEQKQPGSYEVTWNAKHISSGVYFYRLRVGNFVQTKKLITQK